MPAATRPRPILAAAFIDMLLEDYGDEWLTKAMFHYRWVREADIRRSTDVLPLWFGYARPDDVIAEEGRTFADRQIGRLHVVGSTVETGPLIEQSYERFIEVLNAHLREHPFLMGRRPGACDFAVFGQLTQLAGFDPTPMSLTLERAPRVYAWSTFVEDLSGLEPVEADWFTGASMPGTLIDLLTGGRAHICSGHDRERARGCGGCRYCLRLQSTANPGRNGHSPIRPNA